MKKYNLPNWGIALLYLLVAWVIAQFIGGYLLDLALQALQPDISTVPYTRVVAGALFAFVGVFYEGPYFSKTYSIGNPKSIINIATTLLVVLTVAIYVLAITATSSTVNVQDLMPNIGTSILNIGIFYFSSKKYLVSS